MISIIIPLYNRKKTIQEALDSILNQNYQDFEVLIVNDGSTDNPQEKIKKYLNDPRFNFCDLNENKGAPFARNYGFKRAKGELLFFCDADAVLKPEALGVLLNALKNNPGKAYAYSSFLWGRKKFKIGEFDAEKLKSGPMIHTMSLIKRASFPVEGWDESIKKLQDWDLYLTMLKNGQEGIWINKILYQIKTGGTISAWLPACAYKLFPFLPKVKKYKQAVRLVKEKHSLQT